MQRLNLLIRATLIGALRSVASSAAVTAAPRNERHVGPGACGEFMYWRDGKCQDARTKPGKSWMQSVF